MDTTTLRRLLLITTTLCAVSATPAWAGPDGAQIVAGGARVSGQGSGDVTVSQSTDRAIINWQSFDVGQDESIRFQQPRAESITLNRVTNGAPTQILGSLTANGNVFVINGNGVVFGKEAQVHVGGLVVSTADTDNRAFLRSTGQYRFDATGAENAEIVVQGSISARDAGISAFVAPHVVNNGLIQAKLGRIVLAASDRFTLDLAGDGLISFAPDDGFARVDGGGGVESTGAISAQGGTILLTANAARDAVNGSVRVDGMVSASGASRNAEGTVSLTGSAGRIAIAATGDVQLGRNAQIDASGSTGGSVDIAGAMLSQDGAIAANGAGHGGEVRIGTGGLAFLNGTVSANGGTSGGTIEVGAANIASSARISATGTSGSGGTITMVADDHVIATTASQIDASGAAGGKIALTGAAGLFSSGAMLAQGSAQGGGTLDLHGQAITLVAASGNVDGQSSGGAIRIGNTVQADGSLAIDAASVELSPATALSASALGTGQGGTIDVWSTDLTRAWGTTNARGGADGGDGGAIELSSKGDVVFGGSADASAPLGAKGSLLLDPRNLTIDDATARFPQYELLDPHPAAGNSFGFTTLILPTGKVVVSSEGDDFAALNAGAVYVYDIVTGALVSTLTGSRANDALGAHSITPYEDRISVLTNGNFVIRNSVWDNGALANAGAVTWGSASTGISGVVSASNSLVGSKANDSVGTRVTILPGGNYLVSSPTWDNGAVVDAGAVTWASGTSGITGTISALNSLVGTSANDRVGLSPITVLSNGNYLVSNTFWRNGAALNAGAVTWGSGLTGVTGAVSSANSLVGTKASDQVGTFVTALSNGNYLVGSPNWDNGAVVNAGALTWGSGLTGVAGAVSSANSLVGSTANDGVAANQASITELTNGNYVLVTPNWDNGAVVNAGAATWGSGTGGTVGAVSAANSIVGSVASDQVGNKGVLALTNGNYVVSSSLWDNAGVVDAGAATWGSGTGGTVGAVSVSNSLVGTTAGDQVSSISPIALSNGNYYVLSTNWHNGVIAGAGALTWGNGTGGTVGSITASNSLVGTAVNARVGNVTSSAELANGNLVVAQPNWTDGSALAMGAITVLGGTGGTVGAITSANSLIGSQANDRIGSGEVHYDPQFNPIPIPAIKVLPSGNFVVVSPTWSNSAGAVTWSSAASPTVGVVSSANSLVGSTGLAGSNPGDAVGGSLTVLTNGNYVVSSPGWNNTATGADNAGAVTFGSGVSGIAGVVSASNSLVGTQADQYLGEANDQFVGGTTGITALTNGNYVVSNPGWNNGTGAVTWASGITGISGTISAANSLVGSNPGDYFGYYSAFALSNGNYVARTPLWKNGGIVAAGLATLGSGTGGTVGAVSASNSLVGTAVEDTIGGLSADWEAPGRFLIELGDGNILLQNSKSATNRGIVTWMSGTIPSTGPVGLENSFISTGSAHPLQYLGSSGSAFLVGETGGSPNQSRIYVGLSDLNALTYARAQAQDMTISSATVRRVLDSGTALTLQANNDITVNSAINVNNPTGNGGALTLAAGRSIFVNAGITTDNGNIALYANDLLANGVVDAQRAAGDAVIAFGAGGSIDAGTGSIAIDLRSGAGKTNSGSGAITLGSLSGSAISVLNSGAAASGGIALSSGAQLSASGAGNAIVLAGRSFTNNSSAAALNLTGDGRFLVYSNDWDADLRGGIVASNLYNRSYSSTPPGSVTQAGSRFVYTRQPIITVTPDAVSREYGLANPQFTGSVTGGLVNGDAAWEAFTGTPLFTTSATPGSGVGDYAITLDSASLLSDIGYGFAVAPGVLTITRAPLTITANSFSRIYGQANPLFAGTFSGLRNGDGSDVVSGLVFTSAATQASNVGSYVITGAGGSAANYDLSYVDGTLTIDPAALRLIYTANPYSRAYGVVDPFGAYGGSVSAIGLVNGDTLAGVTNGSLAFGTPASTYSNVGSYALIGNGLSVSSPNYVLNAVEQAAGNATALTITPRLLTLMANPVSRIYGGITPASGTAIAAASDATTGLVNGDTVSAVDLASAATALSGVGSYVLGSSNAVFSNGLSSNYSITYASNANGLTITPAPLTITYTANLASRTYGAADPVFSGTQAASGLVNGDTLSGVTAGSASYSSLANATSGVGNYAIIGSGLSGSSANYIYFFEQAPGNATALTITPALLNIITASLTGSASKTYDGSLLANLVASNFLLTGFVNGEGASVNQTVGSYASANAGTGIVVTAALARSNFVANAGTDLGNYILPTSASGAIGTITKAPLTVTYLANLLSRIYGNANPAFGGSVSVSGLVGTDTSAGTLAGSAVFASTANAVSNVGNYAITGSGLSGTSGNYSYSFVQAAGNATALSVTPRSLSITANGQSRIYGNANPTLTYTIGGMGLVGGDTLSGALATGATAASNVGTYAITQGTLAATPNYALSFTGTSLSITPRSLTITYTANPYSRVTGVANPVFTGTTSANGLVNGDTMATTTTGTAVFTTTATTTSAAGSYPINGSGLSGSSGNYSYAFTQAPGNATALTITGTGTPPPHDDDEDHDDDHCDGDHGGHGHGDHGERGHDKQKKRNKRRH